MYEFTTADVFIYCILKDNIYRIYYTAYDHEGFGSMGMIYVSFNKG
jgi:hypothetical protein